MNIENFIIETFCFIDDELKKITSQLKLRSRGYKPALADSEVISMEIIGEFMQIDTCVIRSDMVNLPTQSTCEAYCNSGIYGTTDKNICLSSCKTLNLSARCAEAAASLCVYGSTSSTVCGSITATTWYLLSGCARANPSSAPWPIALADTDTLCTYVPQSYGKYFMSYNLKRSLINAIYPVSPLDLLRCRDVYFAKRE